jgi:multidrug resistance protein, MATE family
METPLKHTGGNRAYLGLGGHMKETAVLAGPVILGQIGHMLIGSADTMMIGVLGSLHLSAATIANSLFFLVGVIGIGVCLIISPLTAQLIGSNRGEDVLSNRLHQGMLVAFWMGLASMVILLGLVEAVPYMGQPEESVPLAQTYLRIIALSLPSMMIFMAMKAFLDGFEAVVPGMSVMGFMVVFHIFFNWVLIHGKLGFPEMGLDGAGWSTVVSRILGMGIMAWYIAKSRRFGKYLHIGRLLKHQWTEIKEILKVGLPSGFQYFFEVGSFSGAVILAGWVSKEAQSAHQIAIQIASFTYMFYLGISTAVSIRVGNAVGRGDLQAIRKASVAAIFCGLVCVVAFIGLMLGLRFILPTLYIDEKPVQAIAASLLVIAAIFQLFDGMQAIIMGALRGMSDVTIPLVVTFVAYWIMGLPGAWFLSEVMGQGVDGIWYGLSLGLAFSAILLSIRLLFKSGSSGVVKVAPTGI